MEIELHLEFKRINNEMEILSYLMENTDDGYKNFDILYKQWEQLETNGKNVLNQLQKIINKKLK
jgi:hypothetical protein